MGDYSRECRRRLDADKQPVTVVERHDTDGRHLLFCCKTFPAPRHPGRDGVGAVLEVTTGDAMPRRLDRGDPAVIRVVSKSKPMRAEAALAGWLRRQAEDLGLANQDVIEQRKKRRRRKGPECCEPGCANRCPERSNADTMSEERAMEASEFHHRCRRCHAAWSVGQLDVGRRVKGRKDWMCHGCGRALPRGTEAWRGSVGTGMRFRERIAVCDGCVTRWERVSGKGRKSDRGKPRTSHAAPGVKTTPSDSPADR